MGVGSHRGHLFALRLCHPPSSANTTYGADSKVKRTEEEESKTRENEKGQRN